MLLVAVIALSGSTFAWFASNTKVEASAMTVKAESASPFIQIKSASDANYSTATATLKHTDGALKLVAPYSISGTTVKWGTAFSNDPDKVSSEAAVTSVAAANLPQYVLTDSVTIKNASADVAAQELRISSVTMTSATGSGIDKLAPATRLLLVWADGYAMYNFAGELIGGEDTIAATFNATSEAAIDLYMYYDGTDDVAYTSLAAGMDDISAKFVITIKGDTDHKATAGTADYSFPTEG